VGKTTLAGYWEHHVADRFLDGHLLVDLHGYFPGPPLQPAEVLTVLGNAAQRRMSALLSLSLPHWC